MKMKILTCFVFGIFISVSSVGQGFDTGGVYDTLGFEARTELSKEAIIDLKNGVLVMRLKTGNNKLKAMSRVANSSEVDADDRKIFEERIANLKKEIQLENERLIQALKEEYKFTEVLFIADTSAHLLKEKKQSGYFLNEQLNIDPSISLNNQKFFVAYYGAVVSATKNGVDGLVVLDDNLNQLVDPFPHFTGLTTTRKWIERFFNKKEESELFRMMMHRFNNRLEEYYKRHIE